MKYTTLLFALSITSYATESPPGDGDCMLAIEHYKYLGEQFSEFAIHADPQDKDYDKKLTYLLESVERWSKDYCYCIKKTGASTSQLVTE